MPQYALTLFPDTIMREIVTVFHANGLAGEHLQDVAIALIYCAAEDALTFHLKWATQSYKTESFMETLSPELNKEPIMKDVNRILKSQVKEPIWEYCTDPWLIYHTSIIRGVYYLESDIDFRIAEWHRITNTPE